MDQADKLRNLLHQKPAAIKSKPARVIAVTSGKGGVGKTNFTVNLALFLQKQNVRVIIVDADFGLANIEIVLGVTPKYSLADVIGGRNTIEEVITNLDSGVSFISGGSGLSGIANATDLHLRHILDNLGKLDAMADVVLIDTGAGISEAVLKFVISASEAILICAPEPTSITDAYSLVKAAKERSIDLPKFKVVINRAENKEEGTSIFNNLQHVAERFLDIDLEYLGVIPYDANLVRAVKSQKPCLVSFPKAAFSSEIENIGAKILDINIEKEPTGMKGFMKRLSNILGKGQ